MVNRKFSYSEIRAFNKNRHEGRDLDLKLQKLSAECGTYHDVTAKQRTQLKAEKTDICRNSGNSPILENYRQSKDSNIDVSKRFPRPWVYSVMEKTYNANYKEAEIPLPKPKIVNRWRSKSAATLRAASEGYSGDASVKNSSTSTIVEPALKRSKSCIAKVNVADSTLGMRQNGAETYFKPNTGNGLSVILEKVTSETDFPLKQNISYEHSYPLVFSGKDNTSKMTESQSSDVEEQPPFCPIQNKKENIFQTSQLNELYNLEKRHDLFMPKLITLPKVYEIEIEASKGAYKRMLKRSLSRVDFSVPIATEVNGQPDVGYQEHSNNENSLNRNDANDKSVVRTDNCHRRESEVNAVHNNKETFPNSTDGKSEGQSQQHSENENSETNKCLVQHRRVLQRSISQGADFIPSTLVQVSKSSKCEDVLFKGRWLRNYIRPEERYKLDPVIVRRRQLKMDKLAKQSGTYLGKINHENISVDIAFPRNVRNRILQQLIDANSSGKCRKPPNPNEEILVAKVNQFLQSVSQYVANQSK